LKSYSLRVECNAPFKEDVRDFFENQIMEMVFNTFVYFSCYGLNLIPLQESWVAPLYMVMLEEILILNIVMGYPIHPRLQVGSVSFLKRTIFRGHECSTLNWWKYGSVYTRHVLLFAPRNCSQTVGLLCGLGNIHFR